MSNTIQLTKTKTKNTPVISIELFGVILASLILTPMALFVHKYKFINDDQVLYTPFLRRALNVNLYPGDYFLEQAQASISLYEDILLAPIRFIGLEWTMFSGYLLAQILLLLGMYGLARTLTGNRAASFLAMVLVIVPISIGGSYVRTYDNYLNPRTLAVPLSLLGLIMLQKERPWYASLLISLHLLIHPLSGLHTFTIAFLLFIWWGWKKIFSIKMLFGPLTLLLVALGVLVWQYGSDGHLWIDPVWREIIQKRTSYVFLRAWKIEDWVSMALYLLLWIVGWRSKTRSGATNRLNWAVLITVSGFFLTTFLAADLFGFAPLAQLQLGRSWRLVILFALIFGADLSVSLFQRDGWSSLLIASILSVTLYLDKADVVWQPILAVVLASITLVYTIEVYQPLKDRPVWRRNIFFTASGLIIVLPSLLNLMPHTLKWATQWTLPDETLWAVLLLFGGALLVKNITAGKITIAQTGAGALLIFVALSSLIPIWQRRNWGDDLEKRLQTPFNSTWMSPTFKAWQDTQMWAALNTPPTAKFITDPDEKGFRVFSGRSPIVEVKDGASVMFNRTYAIDWNQRISALNLAGLLDPDKKTKLTYLSAERLTVLHETYPFDYVVGRLPQDIPWPEVYRNDIFVVYAFPVSSQ